MSRGRPTPRPLSAALEAALAPLAPATMLAAVQAVWAEAVGPRIAAEATPVSEHDGVVTVVCGSAAWAQELDLLSEQVLAKLRAELPDGTDLRGLRFKVGEIGP